MFPLWHYFRKKFLNMSIIASFAENSPIDEQLANAREGVYTFRVQRTIRHRICTLLPIESRTPGFPQLRVLEGELEPHAKTRFCIVDGLEMEIVATVQRVLCQVNSFIEMFLRASELIRNQ
jgi:hypothetical protein